MDHCIISQRAHQDIRDLYEFGVEKFREEQALRYIKELKSYFQLLSRNPLIGRERNEVQKGLFSFPCVSHTIFYRIFVNHIRIVRVLHGSRDVLKFLL